MSKVVHAKQKQLSICLCNVLCKDRHIHRAACIVYFTQTLKMAPICFVCSNTVHALTNEKIREKYKEIIGINLSPNSQLCYICSHVINKLALFKAVCLNRILEYPTLSKKYPMKLQKSDLEIVIFCPEKCDQLTETNSSNTYQFNYSDDSHYYDITEDVNDIEHNHNDCDNDLNNDISNDSQYIDCNTPLKLECDRIPNCNHNDQHYVIETDNYQNNNGSNSNNHNINCIEVKLESTTCNTGSKNPKDGYDKSLDDDLENDDYVMSDSNNQNDSEINVYDIKVEIDNDNELETNENQRVENSNQIGDNTELSNKNTKEGKSKVKKGKKESDKGFKQIILSLEKQKAELEANRKDKKYVEAEFKCYNCALSFLFKDTYQAHMMRHEESNGEYQCMTCTLRFATLASLRIHAACHTERYICRACGSCLKPRGKKRHSCYQPKEPQSVACHLCGNLLKDADGLQQHLKRVHASKASGRRYACNVCGESYTKQGALRTHMIKHINRKFHCDQCPRTYSSPYTLAQHKKSHSSDGAMHYCDTCGAGYATRKSLLAHMRKTSNHSTTTFECPICSRVCPNKKSLASHIQAVHSTTKDHICSLCPARYTNRNSLLRHVASHTKQKPVRIVICHLCGANFKDNSKLNRHLREVCKKAKEEQLLAMYD